MDSPRTEQVVILAGGLGTRLRPITEKIPKPMVEVAGKPFLYWQLLDIQRQGFKKVLLLVAYLGEQIEQYFGKGQKPELGLKLQIEYSYEPEPLGTGGALKNAGTKLDSKFILLNGDSFLHAPLAQMAQVSDEGQFPFLLSAFSRISETPVTPNLRLGPIATVATKRPSESPTAEIATVMGYERGGGPDFFYVDSGIYVLSRELFLSHPETKFQVEHVLQVLVREQKAKAFLVNEKFYDIGTIERLKVFEEKVRDYFEDSISN